jgi:transposase
MKIVRRSQQDLIPTRKTLDDGERAANAKYVVWLTEDERATLAKLTRTGRTAAATVRHAWVLLQADEGPSGPAWNDEQIRQAYGVSERTSARVRRRLVEEGLEAALTRKPADHPPRQKVDGVGEAHLVALACSSPPAGRQRWTLRLLADKTVELECLPTISYETVRRVLKKTNSNRGRRKSG